MILTLGTFLLRCVLSKGNRRSRYQSDWHVGTVEGRLVRGTFQPALIADEDSFATVVGTRSDGAGRRQATLAYPESANSPKVVCVRLA
jgi:hypothetical protein